MRDYALIQQFRFGDRLKIDIDMDPALGNMAVPNMILQPLVENAIEHGLRPRVGPGVVTVSIYSEGESVYCRVCDDGVGCDIQAVNRAIAQNAQGHALANIDQRIKYRYGMEYGVSVSGRAQGGTCALIRLPGAEVIG